ncbi:MAG: hypothetical protein M0Q90_14650 [Bacteroidales bacterium]|nr:hypothetical protein [Bacteroidales bacterium]
MKFYDVDARFTFGKYEGLSLAEVFAKDPKYIDFCSNNIDEFYVSKAVLKELKAGNFMQAKEDPEEADQFDEDDLNASSDDEDELEEDFDWEDDIELIDDSFDDDFELDYEDEEDDDDF